ncbi:MAG: hypothetical protein HZC01_01370 [Candidatus Kerfeldbacteria bacterium]|nr:hypothetical protein [Candidatus Kerfeldbacteria bacterium]
MRKPHFSKLLMKRWAEDERCFFTFCQKLHDQDFQRLKLKQLRTLYHTYVQLNVRAVSSSFIIDGFALGTDTIIQKELQKFLRGKGMERELSRYFSILTAPVHHSFVNETEVALFRIAFMIQRNRTLVAAFRRLPVRQLITLVKKNAVIHSLLLQQERQYFWSKNNYVHDNYLGLPEWINELKAIFKSGFDIVERIRQITTTPRRNLREKKRLMSRLQLPKKIRVLLEISEDFTHWQDSRKLLTYWSTHYGSILLKEIGSRFGRTLHEMKYHAQPEIEALFNGLAIPVPEIRRRMKFCLWYQHDSNQYEIVTGAPARRLYREILGVSEQKLVNDFRGLSACRGVARGRVCIVKSATEIKKVKAGDILVAIMTRPDYIAGMKQAAAIVTNEGGVTCHAAIVSRELDIPCVIGTKIATQVLKDGDIVEVNGNHGVVTVIKRT